MLRNEICEEMKATKTNSLCCQNYTDKSRKRNRLYNILLVGIATIGAPAFFLNHWCAFITTIIVAIGEFFKNFVPLISQPEKELCNIDDINKFYNELLVKLEDLWDKSELKTQDENNIRKQFTLLRKNSSQPCVEMNKLIHHISDKENQRFMKEADEYLKRKFY